MRNMWPALMTRGGSAVRILTRSCPSSASASHRRDRIEYEEWLLKALDASTAPKLFTRRPHITDADADADAASTRTSADGSGSRAKSVPEPLIPLYYPEKLVSEEYVLADLRRMVDLREPHHKSLMKKSLVAAREFRFPSSCEDSTSCRWVRTG